MKTNNIVERLKYAGSILIVVAAVCIMISGAMQYLVGLGRLVLWIGLVLVFALALALASLWLKSNRKLSNENAESKAQGSPEGNGASGKNHTVAFWALFGCLALLSHQVLPSNAQGQYLQGQATKYALIPVGSTFEGRIDKTIGSSASHQGEVFKITLSSPVLSNGQDVVIPAGAEIIGEVVEAIPSKTIPHPKNTPPVTGILRTQLTSLRTPEGTSYPLVASLAGEVVKTKEGKAQVSGLGTSKGYIGTSESLKQTGQKKKRSRPGRGRDGEEGDDEDVVDTWSHRSDRTRAGAYSPGVLDREGEEGAEKENANSIIRSLVKRNGDLFIFAGSPLTVRLKAPFRIAVNRPMDEIPQVDQSAADQSPIIRPDPIPPMEKSNIPNPNATNPNATNPNAAHPNMESPFASPAQPQMTNSSESAPTSQLPSASPGEIIPAPGIIDDKAKLDSQINSSSSESIKQSTTEQIIQQPEDKSF